MYEIGWAAAMALLLILTVTYYVTRLFGTPKKGGLEKPLEGVATGDGDVKEQRQKGFGRSWFGEMLFILWLLVPVIGYIQLILFTLDYYLFAFHVPDQTWLQLGEPFLLVYLISHAVLFLQSLFYAKARVFFMRASFLSEATKVLIDDPGSKADGVLLVVHTAKDKARGGEVRYIEYTCVRYLWDDAGQCFRPSGEERINGIDAKERLNRGGLSKSQLDLRSAQGPNRIDIEVPGVIASICFEFLTPIYIFQFSSIWVYMFYSTWNIATVWLALALASGTTKACLVRRNQLQIKEMAATETTATVLRGGQWQTLKSAEVMPGDILRVEEGTVPCDIAILTGVAVVNESMLTGEPMPVQRFEVGDDHPEEILESHGHAKRHFLFAGTVVMQSSGGGEDGRAIGIAQSTGARTAKGALVRMVLFPAPIQFQFTDHLAKVYLIMCGYVVVTFCILLQKDQGHWIVALFAGFCLLTQSLQPNMPVSFTLGQSIASSRLKSDCGVLCLSPQRIPIAGKVQVMVLDKTGTITKDGMDFAGVHPVDPAGGGFFLPFNSYDGSGRWSNSLPSPLQWTMAACHTVTKMTNGNLIGNAVEVAMLNSSGWTLADDNRTVRSASGDVQLLRRLEFDHGRMTSGAVIHIPSQDRTVALIKGSYERIGALSKGRPLPMDFKAVTSQHATDQYYVLGVGMKEIPKYNPDMTRDFFEKDITFIGLVLFRNELKPDSPQALAELKASGVRCVMCTGDNQLTGAAIAKRCKMMGQGAIIIGDTPDPKQEIVWTSWPDNVTVPYRTVQESSDSDVDLAITKPAFTRLMANGEMDKLLTKTRVYARMKPDDKIAVIHLHQERGWVTGMVGDGGNDCGALRSAHIGLALSDAEASIVAPFSSGAEYGTGCKSLLALGHLLRYGRATLATNTATYMYFMVYALLVPFVKLVLLFMGNMIMSEWAWLYSDILVGSLMVALMTLSWPAKDIASRRPTSALLNARTISTVLMPVGVFAVFLGIALWLLTKQPFYTPFEALTIQVPAHEWQKKGDNYESAVGFLLLGLQLPTACFIFTYGQEHRRAIFWNISLFVVYIAFIVLIFMLVWGGPGELHCVFRVNCDTATSMKMYVPFIQELSTGNIGGCFLGSQLMHHAEKLGDKYVAPDAEANGCQVSPDYDLQKEIRVPSDSLTSWLGNDYCLGPNNCFDHNFRMIMTWLLIAMTVTTCVVGKLMGMWHPGPRQHFKKL
jgi:cation-transporting ATPase 13A3/4/5